MAEGILKFNLPEERSDFALASNAVNWYLLALDLDQHLRGLIKYGDDESKSDDYYKAVEEVRDELHRIMVDRNLTFDDNW